MSIVLETFLIINSVLLSALLITQVKLARYKLEEKEQIEHQKNLVAIEGLADVFSLED
jgi:hypothetical protein